MAGDELDEEVPTPVAPPGEELVACLAPLAARARPLMRPRDCTCLLGASRAWLLPAVPPGRPPLAASRRLAGLLALILEQLVAAGSAPSTATARLAEDVVSRLQTPFLRDKLQRALARLRTLPANAEAA